MVFFDSFDRQKFSAFSFCLCFVICFCFFNDAFGQRNVLGRPGQVMIPSAIWEEKPTFSTGLAFIPKQNAVNFYMGDFYDEVIYHFSLPLTDFMEVNFNLTRLPERERIGIGDRHADVRFRILTQEKAGFDLILVLSPPFSGADFLNHNLVAGTKRFSTDSWGDINWTVGYSLPFVFGNFPEGRRGSDLEDRGFWFYPKRDINMVYMNGFFTGFTWSPIAFMGLMMEFDGDAMHGGLYLKKGNWFSIQVNFYELRHLGGSFGLSLPLVFDSKTLRKHAK